MHRGLLSVGTTAVLAVFLLQFMPAVAGHAEAIMASVRGTRRLSFSGWRWLASCWGWLGGRTRGRKR